MSATSTITGVNGRAQTSGTGRKEGRKAVMCEWSKEVEGGGGACCGPWKRQRPVSVSATVDFPVPVERDETTPPATEAYSQPASGPLLPICNSYLLDSIDCFYSGSFPWGSHKDRDWHDRNTASRSVIKHTVPVLDSSQNLVPEFRLSSSLPIIILLRAASTYSPGSERVPNVSDVPHQILQK